MGLRPHDPFHDPLSHRLCSSINPFLDLAREHRAKKTLPIFAGEDFRNLRGHWRTRGFAQPIKGPLILEVGCHYGQTLAAIADADPDVGVIGMDITYKRVVRSAQRAMRSDAKRLAVMFANAHHIASYFAPAELNGVLVFYPDPWSKNTQKKHRLVKESWLNEMRTLLRADGFFWFRTDHAEYFSEVKEAALKCGFTEMAQAERSGIFALPLETTFAHLTLKKGRAPLEFLGRLGD